MGLERRFLALAAVLAIGTALGCNKASVVAPTLAATCSANPSSGQAPLPVGFALNVAGAQGTLNVQINYGDGSTGSDPSASHTYANAGSYSAAFTLSTPEQSALCSTTVRVDPRPTPTPTPTPVPTANQPPSATFRTNPTAPANNVFEGAPPLTIQFNMCTTSDPEGDPLSFKMDLNGDGIFESIGTTGGDCKKSFTYKAGLVVAQICVTDLNSSLGLAHPYQCKSYVVHLEEP